MDIQAVETFRRKIRVIERAIDRQIKAGAVCCGVSLAQCHALMELGMRSEASIAELAGMLRLDRSTLSRTIDNLVQAGLVTREIDPEDRRYMQVRLTEKGQAIFQGINSASNRFYLKVFEHIPQEKHEQVIESIGLFADALEKVESASESEESRCCSPILIQGNQT